MAKDIKQKIESKSRPKSKLKSRPIVITAVGIILVMAVCIALCVRYVQSTLLDANEKSAMSTAMIIKNNFQITDEEVAYMKTLTFNEMENDPINRRLAKVATGQPFQEPIISVYLLAPLAEDEIKYTLDEKNAAFWDSKAGTKLDAIWLLNMAVKDGEPQFYERDDIYRYTIANEEYRSGFEKKTAFGSRTIDEWGDVITGYVPIYTTQNHYVGMLGVDYDVEQYQKDINQSIIAMVVILGCALAILALLFIYLYKKYTGEQKKNNQMIQREKEVLSTTLNHIQVGVYIYQFIGDEISVLDGNYYVLEMLGRNPEKVRNAKGEQVIQFAHPDDVETVKGMIELLKPGGTKVTREFRLKSGKTGEYLWIVARGLSLKKPDGTVIAYVSLTDDTERKKLQGIETALEVEREANKAKTDFLSMMSHDMRTPMNGILGLVALMKDQELPKEVRDNLEQIQMSGKYLLNLINDTLDVNKIEANRLELHPVVVDNEKLAENICVNSQMLADEKGVTFTLERVNPEQLTFTNLYVDESRVEQIFMNMVSNAVKFTPAGGNVVLRIERLETMDTYICNRYQVQDTGIGMSSEFLKHLYEPFSQEGKTSLERENGTGLGMTIVMQLVKMMDGELLVESKENEGTTFSLTLRLERYQGVVEKETDLRPSRVCLEGKRVLLFEDHPLNQKIAKQLLEKKGMQVDAVSNGLEGVELFQHATQGTYDVILMDVRMPVMDGLDATRQIRQMERGDGKTIPIIAMTANAFDEDVKNCMDAGMNAHIAKPIDIEKMYRILGKYLEK